MNSNPLKILFVTRDHFPPFRVDVTVLFGKEMVKNGYEIDWVMQSQAKCRTGYKTRWPGGDVWVGPTNTGGGFRHRLQKHLLGFIHNIFCGRLLFQNKYDIVQVKDRFFSAVFYLVMARLCRMKYVFWLSFPFPEASLYEARIKSARYPIVSFIRGMIYNFLLYKIILPNADHAFVQSDQMKSDIWAHGIDREKMTVVPMGFDPDQFEIEVIEKQKGSPPIDDFPGIIYLGTLISVRRIDFLIRVLFLVLKEVPRARLYLIGSGETDEDIEMLKREATHLGILESVVFTGFLDRHTALEMVKAGHVCVSPFYPTPILNSTSPTKLMEYMALGKAVVANEHPEQRQIISESGGGICVPYREQAFADAIILLLISQNIREKMGRMGRAWVLQNRSYSIIAKRVEQIYIEKLN